MKRTRGGRDKPKTQRNTLMSMMFVNCAGGGSTGGARRGGDRGSSGGVPTSSGVKAQATAAATTAKETNKIMCDELTGASSATPSFSSTSSSFSSSSVSCAEKMVNSGFRSASSLMCSNTGKSRTLTNITTTTNNNTNSNSNTSAASSSSSFSVVDLSNNSGTDQSMSTLTIACFLVGRWHRRDTTVFPADCQYSAGPNYNRVTVGLQREPSNEYDSNALQVLNATGELVGFVEGKVSKLLSPLMDQGLFNKVWANVLRPKNPHDSKLPLEVMVQLAPSEINSDSPLLVALHKSARSKTVADLFPSSHKKKFKQVTLFGSSKQPYLQQDHKAQKLSDGKCWSSLPAEVLTVIFSSAVLNYEDIWLRFRLVCRNWRALIERPGFMRYRRLYWMSVASSEVSRFPMTFVSPDNLAKLGQQVTTRFPWLSCDFVASLLRGVKERLDNNGDDFHELESEFLQRAVARLQSKTTAPSSSGGVEIIQTLIGGGSRVRNGLLAALLLPSSACFGLHEARQNALELLYFIVCALYNISACGVRVDVMQNVRREVEHFLLLNQAPSALVVPLPRYKGPGGQFVRTTKVQPTTEQLAIIRCQLKPSEVCLVHALAGTGKTTTLLRFAQRRPDTKFFYVAFNRSIREEAESFFPKNVKCSTFHSLAFARVGRKYIGKLAHSSLTYAVLNTALGNSFVKFPVLIKMTRERMLILARASLESFLGSCNAEPQLEHCEAGVRAAETSDEFGDALENQMYELYERLLPLVSRLWALMQDTDNKTVPMLHDGYLKLYHLLRINLSSKYDAILLDEAQDCSPCARDIVMSQHSCMRVLVGDEHQSIYGFTGKENAMTYVSNNNSSWVSVRHFRLSKSFRFGPDIARVANGVLQTVKGSARLVLGARPPCSSRNDGNRAAGVYLQENDPFQALSHYHSAHCSLAPDVGSNSVASTSASSSFSSSLSLSPLPRNTRGATLICRTNATVVLEALNFVLVAQRGTPLAIVGGPKGCGLIDLIDLCFFAEGRQHEIQSDYVKSFKSLDRFHVHVEKTKNSEWLSKFEILGSYGLSPHALRQRCERVVQQLTDWRKSKFLITTAHKSKGLEFDCVILADDFGSLHDCAAAGEWMEVNLMYVACTRAKIELVLGTALGDYLQEYNNFLVMPQPYPLQIGVTRTSNVSCYLCGKHEQLKDLNMVEWVGCPELSPCQICNNCQGNVM